MFAEEKDELIYKQERYNNEKAILETYIIYI